MMGVGLRGWNWKDRSFWMRLNNVGKNCSAAVVVEQKVGWSRFRSEFRMWFGKSWGRRS